MTVDPYGDTNASGKRRRKPAEAPGSPSKPRTPAKGMRTAKRAPEALQGTTAPDTLEYSVSAQVKTRGSEMWVRIGLTSKVRHGETHGTAMRRLRTFVEDQLNQVIEEMK